jgi:hypothetical protein
MLAPANNDGANAGDVRCMRPEIEAPSVQQCENQSGVQGIPPQSSGVTREYLLFVIKGRETQIQELSKTIGCLEERLKTLSFKDEGKDVKIEELFKTIGHLEERLRDLSPKNTDTPDARDVGCVGATG